PLIVTVEALLLEVVGAAVDVDRSVVAHQLHSAGVLAVIGEDLDQDSAAADAFCIEVAVAFGHAVLLEMAGQAAASTAVDDVDVSVIEVSGLQIANHLVGRSAVIEQADDESIVVVTHGSDS